MSDHQSVAKQTPDPSRKPHVEAQASQPYTASALDSLQASSMQPLTPRLVQKLQRVAGNAFAQRYVNAARSRASSLPADVQAKMETAFNADFSSVRIHPDSASANNLGVEAYTQGGDIHFAQGRFQPDSTRGQELLGHELAHVVQQRQGRVKTTMQARGFNISDDDALEREAEAQGKRAARGEAVFSGETVTGGDTSHPAAPIQASGIELLKAKDPAPDDTTPLRDWETLQASADAPSASDVHQILLTYQKLSDGWKSGAGDLLQSIANQYSTTQGIPNSEVAWGAPNKKFEFDMPINVPEGEISMDVEAGAGKSPPPKKMQPRKRGKERARIFEGLTKPKTQERAKQAAQRGKEKSAAMLATKRRRTSIERGIWMKAELLTPRGDAGSDATAGAYANYYGTAVEGHLLNAHLHGPAEYSNLAPFASKLNKKHSSLVEEPLKKMIYNQGRYFRYYVTVIDGASTDDSGFFPSGILCDVVEVNADKSAKDNGYEQHVTIRQDGSHVTSGTNRTGTAPAKATKLEFKTTSIDDNLTDLVGLWNMLKFPWTRDYGAIVREVLDTAYAAIANYEADNGIIGEDANELILPQTEVEFTTTRINSAGLGEITTGKKMVAFPLTMRPPADGGTDATPNFGFEPEKSNWGRGVVKGHLLNHHLHGPAVDENLTPMTNALNQRFEREVESAVKQLILTEGKVLRFEVEMDGDAPEGQVGDFEGAGDQLKWKVQEYTPKAAGEDIELDFEDKDNWEPTGTELSGELPNYGAGSDGEDYQDSEDTD